jgi:3'(2'), 5'-bisphosphate nucleotidase
MIQFSQGQLQALIDLVKLAGEDILQIYHHPESIQLVTKADTSPLTAADLAAHRRLVDGLGQILDVPILSEESSPADYHDRRQWDCFWLIDPLDGTKEFLARNGQFTVNVALIYKGRSILGLVYQPVTFTCYWGWVEGFGLELQKTSGAWRQINNKTPKSIYCESLKQRFQQKLPLRALVSQHHHSQASQEKLEHIQHFWPGTIDIIPLGSSLKICAIAEGSADLYLRLGPTSEWDTAAAQAVLEASGAQLIALNPPQSNFNYNQRDTLINNDFCASSQTDLIIHWLNQTRPH